jgi:hypothetical protein
MKKVDFTQPEILLKKFAEDGTRNVLPILNTDASNKQLADLTNGFPIDTQGDPSDGKLPPERADFNALGYLTTSYDFFYQAGGTFTFSSTIASAIGGYPQGARLWHTNSSGVSMLLESTKDDNEDDFTDDESYIGTSWKVVSLMGIENSSIKLLDFMFRDKQINDMSWVLSDGSWLSSGAYNFVYSHLCDDIGFIVRNNNGTVKIGVSCSDYINGDYIRNPSDDKTVSGTTYYAWKYSTDILYVTLNTSSMSADDAVNALQGQRIYKYENSEISLTIHKITIEETDTYTVGGLEVEISVLVGSDGHRIVIAGNGEEEKADSVYSSNGIAWYYILDKTNTRFKLPRTKHGISGYRGTVGGYIQSGLPAHSHYLFTDVKVGPGNELGIYNNKQVDRGTTSGFGNHEYTLQATDDPAIVGLSSSNTTYHLSDTVQPPSTECYLYFYVGGYTETALQQTAGITADVINSKMDSDMSNMNPSEFVKETIVKWFMPNYANPTQRLHETTYQAETNLLFCYSCDTANHTDSYIQVSSDGSSWINLGHHQFYASAQSTAGLNVRAMQENVGQIFIPKGWYFRSFGGGSDICVTYPLGV